MSTFSIIVEDKSQLLSDQLLAQYLWKWRVIAILLLVRSVNCVGQLEWDSLQKTVCCRRASDYSSLGVSLKTIQWFIRYFAKSTEEVPPCACFLMSEVPKFHLLQSVWVTALSILIMTPVILSFLPGQASLCVPDGGCPHKKISVLTAPPPRGL